MKRNNWHGQRYHWYWSPIKSALHTGFVVLVFIALILLMSSTAFSQDYSKAFDAIAAKDGQENALAFQDAIEDNIRPELQALLAPYVAAIRYAENGKTYQYGIIHKRCPEGYRPQAGWCAATVQKNYDRWVKAGSKGEFVVYLGSIYCPIGADNDPTGLNQHWIRNVKGFYARFQFLAH